MSVQGEMEGGLAFGRVAGKAVFEQNDLKEMKDV